MVKDSFIVQTKPRKPPTELQNYWQGVYTSHHAIDCAVWLAIVISNNDLANDYFRIVQVIDMGERGTVTKELTLTN